MTEKNKKRDQVSTEPADAEEAPTTDESMSENVMETEIGPTVDEVVVPETLVADGLTGDELTQQLAQTAPLTPPPTDNPIMATMVAKAVPVKPLNLDFAYRCHIGALRGRNEDACFVLQPLTGGQEPMPPFGLYIVADGMGGHHNGHVASRMVSRMVAGQVLERIYLPLVNESENGPEPVQDVLHSAVQAANMAIFSPDPDKDMGTTLTMALVMGNRIFLTHVGDSRAYLLVDDELTQLTTDHTLVQRLQDAGQLTAEEAEKHPHRNVLYRAVGQGGELEIDMARRPVPENGKLLLCSDGLWGLVPADVIKDTLQRADWSLDDMVEHLIQLALAAGGHDNITGVLIEFSR